jgi:hypothetical protein
MRRSVRQERKSAEESKELRKSSAMSTENKRPLRCSRSAVKPKSAERLKNLQKKKKTVLQKKFVKLMNKLNPKSRKK